MKRPLAILALALSASALAALPGVTEWREPPEALTDADLARVLDARIAAADVVAIGETVHGSAAMLRMQARLVRYLVERHGLRLIVWETGVARSVALAQWLADCARGRPHSPAPIDVLYMPTAADPPLWEWLCAFNRAHPADPVVFRGMDVWDRPWLHYATVASSGASAGIAPPTLAAVKDSCAGHGARSWTDLEPAYGELRAGGPAYRRCRAALTAVLDAARRTGLALRQAGDARAGEAFEVALSASTLLGWLGFYAHEASDDVLSWNERDRAQGRNLMLLMEQHGVARAVLCAHTSHVSHNRSPADWWGYGDLKSAVHFFEATTGRRVFSLALTAYEASGTQGEWLLPTAANSLDRRLYEAGHAFAFFAADALFLAEHRRWWLQNGNAERFENGVEIVPRDHFDAFVFFARSLLDRSLPRRDIWQP